MPAKKTKKRARRTHPPAKRGAPAVAATPATPAVSDAPAAWMRWGLSLLLCLLVAVGFFPATEAGFVWDDVVLTGAGPLQSAGGLWQIWFEPRSLTDYEGHYWPILYTTFWLENRLWGVQPLGYHLVNMALHAGVVLLLWKLLRRLAAPGAWLAAAVFAVHPLHVESVVWVIGRKDLLATLFYLAAALHYIRFVEQRRRWRYAAALGFLLLSLLSKSIAVTLPPALLLWHWWRSGRVTAADLARVAPLALLAFGVVAADMSFYKGRDPTAFDYSLVERALIAAQALWFYAGKLLWPHPLAVIYPRWEVSALNPLGWGALCAAVALAAALWFARGRIGRAPFAAAALFALTLLPTLGFVDYGYMLYSFVADRYQYLAGAAMIALIIGGAALGVRALPGTRRAAMPLAVAALVTLAALSWRQAGVYRDSLTFYSHIIALNPKARFAHASLGLEYQNLGRYEEALNAYQTDYRLAQQQPSAKLRISRAFMGMAAASESLGQLNQAEAHYRNAVANSPSYALALDHLGAFYLRNQRYDEALDLFAALIQQQPGNAKFYVGRGVAQVGLRRLDEALASYERALSLDPSLPDARANRASLLQRMGQAQE